MRTVALERVHAALEDIRHGKMVILTDDEDRENEGDLVMAAELCTKEDINFMATHARGLICLPMTEQHCDHLGLNVMVAANHAARSTAFTVSIEARTGVTTGISAADRAHTVRVAVSPTAVATDLVSPGHIFPLRARPGGVLQRTGHTEGSVDLARLAGLQPAGVICEIMNDDGTMARYPDLVTFAERHGLRILSIADLVEYRLSRERLVEKVDSAPLTLASGKTWDVSVFSALDANKHFVAMVYGSPTQQDSCLVRVHASQTIGDLLSSSPISKAPQRVAFLDAIARIEREGHGVVLLTPNNSSPAEELAFLKGNTAPKSEVPPSGEVLREFGIGAQVLAELGLRRIRLLTHKPRRLPSLEGYGLTVVEQVTVDDVG